MLPGYNHNVRYSDSVFHIQTEDSGVQNPHIITHLFVGGNIVESRKTSYADIVNSERLNELLVDLMQDQHKAMLKDLIAGRLDHRISARSINAATLNGPAPLNVEAGAQQRASLWTAGGAVEARRPQPSQPAAPPPQHSAAVPPPPLGPAATPHAPPPAPRAPQATPPPTARPGPTGVPPPLPARPAAPAAASRPTASQAPIRSSFFGNAPPASQIIEAETLQRAFDSRNESAVDSIFGEDLISEKSLDEVILSYLAEDMQK